MDFGGGGGLGGEGMEDKELQEFLMKEQQQAIFRTAISKMTDQCWEKCFPGAPGKSLDGKAENCITNCVERFIDTSLHLTQRMQQLGGQQ